MAKKKLKFVKVVRYTKPKNNKVWDICPDFQEGDGTLPLWGMLILPVIGPAIYLIHYYLLRQPTIKEEWYEEV